MIYNIRIRKIMRKISYTISAVFLVFLLAVVFKHIGFWFFPSLGSWLETVYWVLMFLNLVFIILRPVKIPQEYTYETTIKTGAAKLRK